MATDNVTYEDALERWKQDPEFGEEYKALEAAYQITCRRIEKGLTQTELAEMVDIKQPSIARLESGRRDPKPLILASGRGGAGLSS